MALHKAPALHLHARLTSVLCFKLKLLSVTSQSNHLAPLCLMDPFQTYCANNEVPNEIRDDLYSALRDTKIVLLLDDSGSMVCDPLLNIDWRVA